MTFSERNTFFKIGIVFCVISTLIVIAASYITMPAYQLIDENTNRPVYFLHIFFNSFPKLDYLAVHLSIILTVLFSLAGIILIHAFFERTSTPEILYIAIFTISLSFESIRLILPLQLVYNYSIFYTLTATRTLLFVRYFGIFSLFTASICAAGLDVRRSSIIILVISVAAAIVAFSVPIDIQNWDTSLNMININNSMFKLMNVIVLLLTVASFFVAINVRVSKDYAYVALGILFAIIGRRLLLNTDNWVSLIPGFLMLSVGTWFVCSKLHKIHLWL